VSASLLLRFLIRRGAFDRHYQLAMLLLAGGIFAPTAAAVTEISRAGQGNFFFAYFMIFFSFTALFPADVKWLLATSAIIILSLPVSRLAREGGLLLDAELISNLIYLMMLTFIGTALNRVISRLFFHEKRSRIELAAANHGLRELDKAKTSFFSN